MYSIIMPQGSSAQINTNHGSSEHILQACPYQFEMMSNQMQFETI